LPPAKEEGRRSFVSLLFFIPTFCQRQTKPKENEKVPEGEFLPLVPRRGKEKNSPSGTKKKRRGFSFGEKKGKEK
jgi:hypothetical protein